MSRGSKKQKKGENPVVLHADRGVQFTSKLYKELTYDMITSYSRKGNPWDNACIESFHAILKREWLNRFKITDYNHTYRLLFEYLEGFYNTIRMHSHCEFLSSNQYEERYRMLDRAN